MKNALILHGAGNNSQGNWFPWLKSELEKHNFKVLSPDLPNSELPDKTAWLNTILGSTFKFTKDTVLIGHSSGATLILRILESLPDNIKIKKAVLVAAPVELGSKPAYFQYKESLVAGGFDWNKIKNKADQFFFIHSDNDQYDCGISQGKILEQNLNGKLIVKEGEGHFNLEQGEQYKSFPDVLALILN